MILLGWFEKEDDSDHDWSLLSRWRLNNRFATRDHLLLALRFLVEEKEDDSTLISLEVEQLKLEAYMKVVTRFWGAALSTTRDAFIAIEEDQR